MDNQTGRPAWETIVTSTGSSGDLDIIIPVLLVACEPYIATNTRNTRVIKKVTNHAVLELAAQLKEN
jgi:hypothetical protein